MSNTSAGWHVSINGKQQGPYTTSQMSKIVSEGRMPNDAIVWNTGLEHWKPWREVPELAAMASGFACDEPPLPGKPKAVPEHTPAPVELNARPKPYLASRKANATVKNLLASGKSNTALMDYLTFRRMITPMLIQIVFWLGVVAIVMSSLIWMLSAFAYDSIYLKIGGFVVALIMLVVQPVMWRIVCEWVIIFFRINETLTEIKNATPRS